jgi:hypothetical protein
MDTARLILTQPINFQPQHTESRPAQLAHLEKPTVSGQSTKQNEKSASAKVDENHTNQAEQVYVIDDSSNYINDDDDDSQRKYIFGAYKSRLASSM